MKYAVTIVCIGLICGTAAGIMAHQWFPLVVATFGAILLLENINAD